MTRASHSAAGSGAASASWAINGRFLTQQITGVQRYAREITQAIDARLATDESMARTMRWEIIVPANCDAVPAYQAITVRQSRHGRGHAWEQMVLPAMARGGLVNFANLAPLAHDRQIVCLHDANVFVEPDSYAPAFRLAYRLIYPLLGRRARAVTTVSQFSRTMLERSHVIGREKTAVIGNGHEHALGWNATASRFDVPGFFKRPFVFALGSRAKHKQVDKLIALAPELDALGIDLVVSGGTAAIYAGSAISPAPNVMALGFVSDDDLAALFRHALCFAFPSRTEGFGIPLLEAMVHGCPIITSDCASMPEVCGDAALYAPVDDFGSWLAMITALRDDPALSDALRDKGRHRYPQFSWDEGARRYLDLASALSVEQSGTPFLDVGIGSGVFSKHPIYRAKR